MIYIYKDRIIRLEWTILKGTSHVKENFDRALVKLFLIGPADKYLLDATAENGVITATIPQGLPEGNYSVEVIYAKNWGNLRRGDAPTKPMDERFNDRCLMRSRKDDLFGITNYESEADNVGEGEVVVSVKSSVATYGYDGLSVYELAVMRGTFIGSESAFIALINNHVTEHFAKYVNSIQLEWNGSAYLTRISTPIQMRRKGLMISYVNGEGKAITEKCVFDADTTDVVWGLDSSWQSVEDLVLGGELFVSPNGTWVIDGVDTGINAVGMKGDNGITPLLKTIDNKLHYSYDGNAWVDAGADYIASWFRWSGNKIQISRDNKTWSDLSGEFADNLFIKGYVATYAELPTSAVQGDIWGVGPTYAADDTEHTNPIYRYYVKNASGWVDNGSFTSISAGIVQETGDGENVVMSQKAVTEKLTELESEVQPLDVTQEDIETSILLNNQYINTEGVAIFADGFAVTYAVTLQKGESISAYVALYENMVALAQTQQHQGYGDRTPLVLGKGINQPQWHHYTATEDNTYIVVGYKLTAGVKVIKTTSKTISDIYETLEAHTETLDAHTETLGLLQDKTSILEVDVHSLSAINAIKKTETVPNIMQENVAVKWEDGSDWSYPGYNRTESITLQKGQAILIRANVATQMAALYETSHYMGYGTITRLVQGNGNQLDYYFYRAVKDSTYIGATYKVSDGIEVYIIESDAFDEINTELSEIKNDLSLKEPLYLSSFPLRDGQLLADGGSEAAANRKNTGVFANINPLHISVNAPFQVNYRYGDDTTAMADGGYLISDDKGGEVDVEIDAKYIGFTIVKPSSESFDNLKFFVCPKDSNDEKTLQIIEENKIESKRELNKVLYESNAIVEKTLAAVAGEDYRNNIDISLKKGETILVKVNAPSGEFKTRSVAIVAPYQSEAIGYASEMWTGITLTEDVDYIGVYRYRSLVTISEDVTLSIKRKNVALLQQKMEQIYNTTTLSNSKHTLAICDGYDINDNGELCAGMWAADNSVEEHDPPTWRGYLLRANLADLVGTREDILAFDTWNEKIDNWTINYVQNSFACWLSDGNIALVSVVGQQLGDNQRAGYYCKVYDVESKTFSEPQLLTIKVGDNTYNMLHGYGTTAEADITQIWEDTNLEHFVRYESEIYNYNIGFGAIRYNGAYYAVMQLGSQSGALCKSSDMINWEFLCDMQMGQITLGEVAITIKDGILYTIGRGEYQLDKHYGVVKKCTLSAAESGSPDWSDSVYLPSTTNERPTITELNGKLYLMHGFGTSPTTDGRTIARGNKALVVMDLDLNVLQFDKLVFTYPLLHPIFKTYGGNIFNISSTDKRCFAWTKSGDTRSEIGFGHINEKILDL